MQAKKDNKYFQNKMSNIIYIELLISGIMSLLTQSKGKFGYYVIYINSILPILFVILAVWYIVLFCVHGSKYLKRSTALAIILVILCFCELWIGSDYMKDAVNGTQTITTNYFVLRESWIRVYDESGNDYYLYLSEKQSQYLHEHESEVDTNDKIKISPALSINGHEQGFTFEYYPNTHIAKSIKIE